MKRFESYGGRVSKTKSRVLSAVRYRDTKPELLLRRLLRERGLQFETHAKDLPGKPDIVFRRLRLVIFCDGDFWHGRKWKERQQTLKVRREYWLSKIEGNIARDRRHMKELTKIGWKVVRVWEFDIYKKSNQVLNRIAKTVEQLEANAPFEPFQVNRPLP